MPAIASPQLSAGLGPIVGRLAAQLAPDRIVLFGSRLDGRARPDSDIDLLLIGPFVGDLGRLRARARALVADRLPRLDVVLARPEEVATSSFLRSVVDRGTVVWSGAAATAEPPECARISS